MAVEGSVVHTVRVRLDERGEVVVVRREQAHRKACSTASLEEIEEQLINGETVWLTERRCVSRGGGGCPGR